MNNKIYKSTEELTPFIIDMISKGKSVKLTVTGNSMFPLFCHEREIVEIRKCPVYRKYDIILYVRKSGELVLHRIVKVKDDVFHLCGDNQLVVEYPIYEDQIIGKVVSFNRKGKEYAFDSFFSKAYARIWCLSLKLRKPLMKLIFKIYRMKNK